MTIAPLTPVGSERSFQSSDASQGPACSEESSPQFADWFDELTVLCALILAITAGQILFYRAPIVLTLGPVAGLMAGLGCRRWGGAAAVGAFGVLIGNAGATFAGDTSWSWANATLWSPGALEAAAVAAFVGAITSSAIRRRRGLRPLISFLAVAAIVGTMWVSAFMLANHSEGGGPTQAEQLTGVPSYRVSMTDDDLFLNWVNRLRAGDSYYPMEVRSYVELNAAAGSNAFDRIHMPFSYRLPTLYVMLAALPRNGIAMVIAMMSVCSVGVIAAYTLARRYVRQSAGLASAILVAAPLSSYGGLNLLNAESWAGPLVLAAVAAFLVSRSGSRQSQWLNIASVVFAVAATAFREIAAPLLVLGLIATLSRAELRRPREWIAWLIGIAAAAVIMSTHWFLAAQAYSGVAAAGSSRVTWFSPDGSGLVGAVYLMAAKTGMVTPAVWFVLALGVIGSMVAPADWPSRIMLAGVATGGPLVLLVAHPPGWTAVGVAPGYWGDIAMPTIFACVVLAFARVPSLLRTHRLFARRVTWFVLSSVPTLAGACMTRALALPFSPLASPSPTMAAYPPLSAPL